MNQKREKISDYGFTSKGKFIKKIKYDIVLVSNKKTLFLYYCLIKFLYCIHIILQSIFLKSKLGISQRILFIIDSLLLKFI